MTRKVWKSGPSGGTPITASELNRIEEAIEAKTDKRYVDATVTGLDQPMTIRVSVRDLVAQNREGLAPSHPYSDPTDNDVTAMQTVVNDLLQRNTYNLSLIHISEPTRRS